MKKDENQIILKTDLDSGHSGASCRFDYIQEVAEEFAFIMKVFVVKM